LLSLYADDAAIFATPTNLEIEHLHRILNFFGGCSGLRTNISKTEIYPIRLANDTVTQLLQNFPGKVCNFLGKYLGLPLHVRRLRRIDVQPLLDKIGARIPGWKGRFLTTAGRETLVKTVLLAQPIYHMTVFLELKWLIRRIDRIRRSFLWRGETPDKVYGGHSLVNWPTSRLPKVKGGSGSWTSSALQEHFVSAGSGSNGVTRKERGPIWSYRVITGIETCLRHRRW
jgi:hypothetical protein